MRTNRLIKVSAATAVAAAVVCGGASAASANSDSESTRFDNGQTLTANIWIQSFTWTSCGSFQSSAVMTASPNWIKNHTAFYQIGLGSVSIKGASLDSDRSSSSVTWTNSNGSRGSYISGKVCGGWGAFYVGADTTAQAYYYGNLRSTTAHV